MILKKTWKTINELINKSKKQSMIPEIGASTAMAVRRKSSGSQKILIFLYIHIVSCGLFYTSMKHRSSVSTWQEFYVCSEVVKAKIFNNGFKRRRKNKQRVLPNSLKLALGCRLLLYALFSVFLIKLSGDVEINPGPSS